MAVKASSVNGDSARSCTPQRNIFSNIKMLCFKLCHGYIRCIHLYMYICKKSMSSLKENSGLEGALGVQLTYFIMHAELLLTSGRGRSSHSHAHTQPHTNICAHLHSYIWGICVEKQREGARGRGRESSSSDLMHITWLAIMGAVYDQQCRIAGRVAHLIVPLIWGMTPCWRYLIQPQNVGHIETGS